MFKEVTTWTVMCDCCEAEYEYEEFAAWTEKSSAIENADEWQSVGDLHLCDECWCWPEDLPDYPGDDRWQGGDDPVRKVGCHPVPTSPNSTDEGNN